MLYVNTNGGEKCGPIGIRIAGGRMAADVIFHLAALDFEQQYFKCEETPCGCCGRSRNQLGKPWVVHIIRYVTRQGGRGGGQRKFDYPRQKNRKKRDVKGVGSKIT